MLNRDFTEFIEDLSSSMPAPGGGAVVGVNAILGASLLLMVVNLTIDNKNYIDVRDEAIKIRDELLEIKEILMGAPRRDAEAFTEVARGFRMKRSTEEEKKARSEVIENGYKFATDVPYETLKTITRLIPIGLRLYDIGNITALGDVLVGLKQVEIAIFGSIENMVQNIKSIKDEKYVSKMEREIEKYLKTMRSLRASLDELI